MNVIKKYWPYIVGDLIALAIVIAFFVSGHPVLAVMLFIMAAVFTAALIYYKNQEEKSADMEKQIEATKQTVSMFVISKKMMKMNEAGLPAQALQSVPKLMRRQKLPILKVKVGPQVMNLICDSKIFDSVPEKKEVKASVSGIYVSSVKGLHGSRTVVQEEKKKGFWKRALEKAQEKAGAKQIK